MQTLSPLSIVSSEVNFFNSSCIFHAFENKRSPEAEDAGVAKNRIAIFARLGN
jgi:hypothetical protein